MGDLLADGAAWLAGVRATHAAATVVYSRGADSVELAATRGASDVEEVDETGGYLKTEAADWIIRAADLVLDGSAVRPARGDRITHAGRVYEVMPFGGEPEWRWADRSQLCMRIHTKLVEET